jgi:ABC-type antimicrobial peptide transport system permease subunit
MDIYLSARQARPVEPLILASPATRDEADFGIVLNALREAARRVDGDVTIPFVRSLAETDLGDTRFVLKVGGGVLSALGGCALVLSLIGIYSVVAYSVSQRTREIALRVALGATGQSVVQMFVREGLTLVGLGLVIGLGLVATAGQLMRSVLAGIDPFDPVAFGVAAAAFGIASLLGCYVPSLRAMRIQPMLGLRGQ